MIAKWVDLYCYSNHKQNASEVKKDMKSSQRSSSLICLALKSMTWFRPIWWPLSRSVMPLRLHSASPLRSLGLPCSLRSLRQDLLSPGGGWKETPSAQTERCERDAALKMIKAAVWRIWHGQIGGSCEGFCFFSFLWRKHQVWQQVSSQMGEFLFLSAKPPRPHGTGLQDLAH